MPIFDISFLNPSIKRGGGGGGYNILTDQLSIKENELALDGKLSPGDYDILTKMAQGIYGNPALTQSQRSDVLVKISQYKKEKSTSSLKDSRDIETINRQVQDDHATNIMFFGNDPQTFLKTQSEVLKAKLDILAESIDGLQAAGDDASSHINEYSSALSEYNDILEAANDAAEYQSGTAPKANFVSFVTTNSDGEITDVSVGRIGSKTGYTETNGIYGGLQIYGKINRKESGKNIFQIGNNVFAGSDLIVQDPNSPGAFRNAPLLSTETTQGKNFGVVVENYKDIDLSQVRTQNFIRPGGWGEGEKGFLYKRLDNGSYEKYINAKKENLGIKDNDIIKLPKTFENKIIPYVNTTIDPTVTTPTASLPLSFSNIGGGTALAPQTSQPNLSQRTPLSELAPRVSETQAPVKRSPQQTTGYASSTLEKAKGFLSSIFNR